MKQINCAEHIALACSIGKYILDSPVEVKNAGKKHIQLYILGPLKHEAKPFLS